jgi:hypothetical protein
METLKLAARPAVLVLIWIVASAHMISQLSTVEPALRAAQTSGVTVAPPPLPPAGAAALARRPVPVPGR